MMHLRVRSERSGLVLVALAATTWGLGGFVAAVLFRTSGLGPFAVSFWRYVGAALLLGAARLALRRGPWRAGRNRVLLTGLTFVFYQTAYYVAIPLTGLAVSTMVTLGAGPVLIAFGARLFLGERLSVVGWSAVAGSVLGLVLLTGPSRPGVNLAGVAIAGLSGGGWAAVTLIGRGLGRGDDPLDAALGGFAVGAVGLLPLGLLDGLWPHAHRVGSAGLLLFLGAVPGAAAYGCYFAGLAAVRAGAASVVSLVEPLVAAVLGVAGLGERLAPVSVAGGIVLLASITAAGVSSTATAGSPPPSSPR